MDLAQQIAEARKAGHSDDDIVGYLGSSRPDLAPKIQEAKTHGYSASDIVGHLSGAPAAAAGQPDASKLMPEPKGSAIGRFGGALWDSTIGGLIKTIPVIADLAGQGFKAGPTFTGPAAEAVQNLVQGHYEQAQKAKAAWDSGNHVEALGHSLATVLPVMGPGAARAAERMTGRQPVLRGGQVIDPGAAPDVAGGLGEALGLLGSMFAPEGLRRVGPASIRVGPVLDSKLNPVEQSAVDFLKERGVPLPAGVQTGNKFVKSAEAVTRHQPLGAAQAEDFLGGTEAGLRQTAGDLSNEITRVPATPESAGRNVAKALGKNIEGLGAESDAAYAKAWEGRDKPQFTESVPVRTESVPELDAAGKPTGRMTQQPVTAPVNMPVDVRQIKESLKPVWDEMQWMPASDRASSAGYQAVKNILEGDDYIPAWQAERGLSGMKTMARVDSQSGVRNVSQGIGASIIPTLQEAVDAAVAKTGDTAIRGLQNGRALHATKMEIADIADQLRTEPVQNFGRLVWAHDTGIDFLRKINAQAPDVMPQVGRAYVDQLFDQATREGGFAKARTILSRWQDLGPETKAVLFPDRSMRQSLDRFFKGAEMVGQTPNPSGTALVNSATSPNPLRWLAGYAGSKVLYTPRGVQILTEGLRAPLGGARGALAENGLKRLAEELSGAAMANEGQQQ